MLKETTTTIILGSIKPNQFATLLHVHAHAHTHTIPGVGDGLMVTRVDVMSVGDGLLVDATSVGDGLLVDAMSVGDGLLVDAMSVGDGLLVDATSIGDGPIVSLVGVTIAMSVDSVKAL